MVRAIVDNVRAEDGCGKWRVYLFSTDILKFAIQDKLATVWSSVNRGGLPKENKGEDVAILLHVSMQLHEAYAAVPEG